MVIAQIAYSQKTYGISCRPSHQSRLIGDNVLQVHNEEFLGGELEPARMHLLALWDARC